MKQILLGVAALFFITFSPMMSYDAEKEQQAAAPAPSPHREQYESTMEEKLGKLGKQLDELNARAMTMTEQAREQVKHQLAEAEKKHAAASRKLEEIRKKSGTEWDKFSHEMNQAAEDFEKAYEKAKSRFK